jgi:predicted NUDIX family NTP pyrophosphohydrolase
MKKPPSVSAGLLLFRRPNGELEVLLAHPGGPFWTKRDHGAWTVPKGLVNPEEDYLIAARREFEEEVGYRPDGPFIPLGSVRQKSGKVIHVWACEGDLDPDRTTSNVVTLEWPPGSGLRVDFPEVDQCKWFSPKEAQIKLNPAQVVLVERLESTLIGRLEQSS